MSESTTPVAAERPAEPLVYRPIAGLAIAGLTFAILYAGLVLFGIGLALFKGEPFFLGAEWYVLAFAIAGGVCSFLALRQIRTSEGTRAGASLAQVGLWLSILCGLGSFAYTFATKLAVKQQANDFVLNKGPGKGFFPLIQAGQINAAFLLTKAPDDRQLNPNNENDMEKFCDLPGDPKDPHGPLSYFRKFDYVCLLQQPCEEIIPRSADCYYESKSYVVQRTYRIRNAEGVFDIEFRVKSMDSSAPGEGRKWQVVWAPGQQRVDMVQLTPWGEKMVKLRQSAAAFADIWLQKLAMGAVGELYADMRSPVARRQTRGVQVALIQAAPASILGATSGGPSYVLLPALAEVGVLYSGSEKAAANGPIVATHPTIRGDDKNLLRPFLDRYLSVLGRVPGVGLESPPRIGEKDVKRSRWQKKDGRLEMTLDVEVPVPLPAGLPAQGLLLVGRILLEADANTDPRATPDQVWRVVRLEIDRALPLAAPPDGMPRRPQGRPG